MPKNHQTSKPQRAVLEINPHYRGYLMPHAERIRRLASEGRSPRQIGRVLFEEGVRSPQDADDTGPARRCNGGEGYYLAALVKHMLRPSKAKKEPKRTAQPINPNYRGYLKPHVETIQRLAGEGRSPGEIARTLYADGVRSPFDTGPDEDGHRSVRTFAAMIYALLGLRPNAHEKKLQRRIARRRESIARAQRELRELEQQEQRA